MYVFVRDWMVELGRDECNGLIEGAVWEVIAEMDDGSRYAHQVSFAQHGIERSPEGFASRVEIDPRAAERAQRLADRVAEMSQINLEYWSKGTPRYGSEAYQQERWV